MRLARLHLQAFGPFTDRLLDFGPAGRLVLVHGPNEAGKSSTLRAVSDLRFGIPQQSRDNFVHAHPEMRVGGVFVDGQGREYAVVRRKGRGATLLDAGSLEPVPPELEARLTCGLSKDEYDASFGLDHERLRKGGKALLEGEGEVGAALFEASAGVRSIPQVLERLDQTARKYFMPGARGRHAKINEGLRAYDEHHAAYRQALVRPAHWADLFRKHRAAADALAALEGRRAQLHAGVLLVRELRAVAPLLAALDHATRALLELGDAPLLPESAPVERAAAQAGLADAAHNASLAAAEAQRHRERLDALEPDEAVLEVAPLLRRLAAAAQAIDRSRAELAEASADVGNEAACAESLAARIDPSAPAESVLERIPAPTARAELDERLRTAERAGQALEQHRESARQQSAQAAAETLPPLPSPEARTALRIAQAELARHDAPLRRLAELPGTIRAARRTLDAGLEALGLPNEAALRAPRPMLDALIDEAIERQRSNATRREEREARIAQISAALQGEHAEHRRLLERGAVPTADDVREARGRRDAVWRRLRDAAFGPGGPAPLEAGALASMADAHEAATAYADRLADALALDSERAARLQSCQRNIAALERDRQSLQQELERILGEEALRLEGWQRTLGAARLPELSPSALRDWQALLARARASQEVLRGLQDELERAGALGASLAASLRTAILGTGLASPPDGAALDLLSASAAEVDAEIRQREQALGAAAGQRLQFERQQAQMQARGEELAEALRVARRALLPLLARLGLPADAGLEVVRARLGEFDALSAAQARLSAARAKQQRASTLLSSLEDDARAIATRLGDPEAGDVRAFIDRATARLEAAEGVRNARALALQALERAQESRRMHEEAASGHRERLARLCLAAGVASDSELPEAEERSHRRRELQATIDRASGQLAEASRRPVAELRTHLADRDAAGMDAEEASIAQEQSRLDEALPAAREHEEAARHALQAIDGTDAAAAEREAMERSAAGVRAAMSPWIRSRLAHALLSEALARFRDRAQAPMLRSASGYFERMTGGEFVRLAGDDSDERPVLVAERRDGSRLRVEGMSEGTRDQLYLALRLAALELRRAAGVDLPVILDDVLMTSDDRRAGLMLGALADLARGGQVVVFTHHGHLAEVARACLPAEALTVVELGRS